MARRVVVVVDPELGDRVALLRATQPVWVVDSPVNAAAWGKAKSLEPNSAIFEVQDPGARADNLVAELADVDLHFGPDSYPENPYVGIRVIGLRLTKQIAAELDKRGFGDFREADDGFEADIAV
jgi:hypothetical protein